MSPIVTTVVALTIAALAAMAGAMLASYRRRARREEPRFVTVAINKGHEEIDTRGCA